MSRPYCIMLVAVSLDGKIAPRRKPGQENPVGPSLIPPDIMAFHNRQRAEADGIMVGLNAVVLDDSRLTLRGEKGHSPTRVILDGLGETPPTARALNRDAPTIVAVTENAPAERIRTLEARGAHIAVHGKGRYVSLPPLMEELYTMYGLRRLLVEGGGTVHRSMLAEGFYDELRLIVCPFVIGGSASVTPVERRAFGPLDAIPRFRLRKTKTIGDYLYVVYTPA